MTMTQVSSDLAIVAVRASYEAGPEADAIGRDATSLFNRHRDRTDGPRGAHSVVYRFNAARAAGERERYADSARAKVLEPDRLGENGAASTIAYSGLQGAIGLQTRVL